MRERDMTPDEMESFEEDIVQGADEAERDGRRERPDSEDPLKDVDPGDEDGLPDGPAKFRVPS